MAVKGMITADKAGLDNLIGIAMFGSNAYGLIIALALLGYGLTEWPKKLWRKSKREETMKSYEWQVYHSLEEYDACKSELDKTLKLVRKYDEAMPDNDPNRKYLLIIISKCPPMYREIKSGSGDYKNTYKDLVNLHTRVMNVEREFHNARALYEDVLRRAWNLQDVNRSSSNTNHVIEWTFKHKRPANPTLFQQIKEKIQWYWRCRCQVTVLRIGTVICALMSLSVVWSETLFSVDRVHLSVLYWLTQPSPNTPYVVQIFIVIVTIAYLDSCAYWRLFRFRIIKFYW
eukprot:TRINITY_DN4215_c0_g1_i2.p1 TRINITY_DN4215_c0_g1~~TRINITY_DN4215_c0_g1_i2.p1  ORF type:complete len:287 (+),score=62.96 TRINITY_DN4215_c0_g1_i2:138-998(+)